MVSSKNIFQVVGVYFNENFSPVSKFIIMKRIFTIGAAMNWKIHQMEVMTLFFNEVLMMEIYMDHPDSFTREGKEYLVCKLMENFV